MADNVVTGKIEVLDKDICKNCKYIKITAKDPSYLYADGRLFSEIWEDPKFYCGNLVMCKYLQKLFASETPSKVEESESDP